MWQLIQGVSFNGRYRLHDFVKTPKKHLWPGLKVVMCLMSTRTVLCEQRLVLSNVCILSATSYNRPNRLEAQLYEWPALEGNRFLLIRYPNHPYIRNLQLRN